MLTRLAARTQGNHGNWLGQAMEVVAEKLTPIRTTTTPACQTMSDVADLHADQTERGVAVMPEDAPSWSRVLNNNIVSQLNLLRADVSSVQDNVSRLSGCVEEITSSLGVTLKRVEELEKFQTACTTEVVALKAHADHTASLVVGLQANLAHQKTEADALKKAQNVIAADLRAKLAKLETDLKEMMAGASAAIAGGSGSDSGTAWGRTVTPAPVREDAGLTAWYRQSFKLVGMAEGGDMGKQQLAEHIEKLMAEKLKGAAGAPLQVKITDAYRMGRRVEGKTREVMFRVATACEADALVKARKQLKGQHLVIRDHLTPAEFQVWKTLNEKRKQLLQGGKAAFWRGRNRLFVGEGVDAVEVKA